MNKGKSDSSTKITEQGNKKVGEIFPDTTLEAYAAKSRGDEGNNCINSDSDVEDTTGGGDHDNDIEDIVGEGDSDEDVDGDTNEDVEGDDDIVEDRGQA